MRPWVWRRGLSVDDLDRAEGLLAADQILGPAARMQRRVDQLGPRPGLAACQWPSVSAIVRSSSRTTRDQGSSPAQVSMPSPLMKGSNERRDQT